MKDKINKNQLGLILGTFLAVVHLAWAIAVASKIASPLLTWILKLHSMSLSFAMLPFNAVNSILLIVVTFIVGYIFGWVFGLIWNWISKK